MADVSADLPDVTISAFPRGDSCWRIDWFGEIAFPDRMVRRRQPSVLVYLSRVVVDGFEDDPAMLLSANSTAPAARQRKCWVSVGTMTLLRVGDIWRDQRPYLAPDYQLETLDLDIDDTSAVLVKAGLSRDDEFLLPLEHHPWHLHNTHAYCVAVTLKDGREVVVPCMELIRFYFGSSSSLLTRLPSFGLSGAQLSASTGYSNSNTATHNISETGQLSVNVNPDWIVVQRNGVEGVDLVGNVLVQAALKADESLLDAYYVVEPDVVDDKTNAFKAAANAKLSGSLTDYLRPRQIGVCYYVTYVNRVVLTGAEMRDEGAQSVAFVSGIVPGKRAVVVGEHETRVAVWHLTDALGVLKTDTPSGFKTMVFDDYDKAQVFKAWLQKQRSAQIGVHRVVGPDDQPITGGAFDALSVQRGFPGGAARVTEPACGDQPRRPVL